MGSEDIIEKIASCLKEYDVDKGVDLSKSAVESGIDSIKVIEKLTSAIKEIGEAFGREELFLPDLMMASDVMKNIIPI